MLMNVNERLLEPIAPAFIPAGAPPCTTLSIFEAHPQLIAACTFEKTATGPIIVFEAFVIIGTIIALWLLSRLQDKIRQRYLIVAVGVFLFEFFTSPMWNNYRLGPWAYVYQDVSWILTLEWSTLILLTVILVDHFGARFQRWQRFGLYLIVLTIVELFAEALVINLGVRSYAPEVQAILLGPTIMNVPIEVFYYVPVFMALVISFYKYWSLVLDDELIVPAKKQHWLGSLALVVAGILLFELMIEPMVVNLNLPNWSYVYHDVSFLMTGLWVVVVWLAMAVVDRWLIHLDLTKRFLTYLAVIGVVILPIESWFINHGFRVYGPSATANFSGFTAAITNVPVEVAFAIPLYLALVIAFVRYWEFGLGGQR
jgi:hypothetical protein